MTGRHPPRRGYLTREDMQLWAHVTQTVKPFRGRSAFVLPADLVETAPVKVTPPVAEPAPPAPVRFLPPLQPLDRRLKQRLTRGRKDIDGVIDLHGMRQAEAHGALIDFIHRAHREHRSLVLVITGKGSTEGMSLEGRGVLNRLVPHWLTDPAIRRQIIGFEPAGRSHGGSGALYVRIRKSRPPA
ncbi:MAG TPA: Smr/MutS family protein [Beijerinckiaceae bacterium]|nr:Smr/MutS family protein [Beijerinckiaceae bacterium]